MQKQAAEALKDGEARIRSLGDNLPSGMMYQLDMGRDGLERRFTYVSAGVEKLHEVTAAEVLQDAQVLYKQVAAADQPLVAAREAAALAAMQPFMAELRMQLPSGAERWSLFTSAPRRAANGHVIWDGIELDITAQKEAEEVLRQKKAQLMQAMEVAKLAHWEFDVVKYIVTADERLFQMMGTSSAQEGTRSLPPEEYIRRFVHPEDASLVASEVAGESRRPTRISHASLSTGSSARTAWSASCSCAAGSSWMTAGARAKSSAPRRDITEQKQAELRIRQLNRIYAVLSAINKTIVHEKTRRPC